MATEERRAWERAYRKSAHQRAKRTAQMRAYRTANADRINATRRARRAARPKSVQPRRPCGECGAIRGDVPFHKTRAICLECWKPKKRALNVQRLYGVDSAAYDALLERQHGRCAICQKHEPRTLRGVRQRLSVDHHHGSKRVRGLLCSRCNPLLGYAFDDVVILRAAIKYLLKDHRKCRTQRKQI